MSWRPKVYTEEDRALFARYVAARAAPRPAGCNYGADCWVELGPPGMDTAAGLLRCRGCGCSLMDGRRGVVPGSKRGPYKKRAGHENGPDISAGPLRSA